ncbi:MAG: hypothetical protein QW244_02245 [Candidatus Pacearchaeota archaeon]
MIIKLLVEAGNMKPNPAISQKLGPLGINMGKVIAEVNKATASYANLKVPVELDINTATKEFKVNVLTPPTSELLKKELNIKKASPMPPSIYVGNLAIEQIINIAKKKTDLLNLKVLKSTIKSVLGTCVSSGILVESKSAKDIIDDVNKGVYDGLIEKALKENLVVNKEKKEALEAEFAKVQASQEKLLKELQKAKEEAAAAKAAAAAGAAAPAIPATTTAQSPSSAGEKGEGKEKSKEKVKK